MQYFDQLGETLTLSGVPQRIVSLVPSQTELLVRLGLEDKIVGITKFCVHPPTLKKNKAILGGTKKIRFDIVEKMNPDIVLCNKEENTKDMVEELRKKYPVHVSDITTIAESIEMIRQYGVIFQKQQESETLISKIMSEQRSFQDFMNNRPPKRVGYFIWKDPWMVAGRDTFIDHLLRINGFENVFKGKAGRYPVITERDMQIQDIDIVLLSSEPFPFSEKHILEIKSLLPGNTQIQLVDGEYFSWYGSRLALAFTYFRTLH